MERFFIMFRSDRACGTRLFELLIFSEDKDTTFRGVPGIWCARNGVVAEGGRMMRSLMCGGGSEKGFAVADDNQGFAGRKGGGDFVAAPYDGAFGHFVAHDLFDAQFADLFAGDGSFAHVGLAVDEEKVFALDADRMPAMDVELFQPSFGVGGSEAQDAGLEPETAVDIEEEAVRQAGKGAGVGLFGRGAGAGEAELFGSDFPVVPEVVTGENQPHGGGKPGFVTDDLATEEVVAHLTRNHVPGAGRPEENLAVGGAADADRDGRVWASIT